MCMNRKKREVEAQRGDIVGHKVGEVVKYGLCPEGRRGQCRILKRRSMGSGGTLRRMG